MLLFVTGYEPELSENRGECSMQSTSIITCENPQREPNVLKIALSHFKIIIRVQTLLHPVPSTSIVRTFIDYILVVLVLVNFVLGCSPIREVEQ